MATAVLSSLYSKSRGEYQRTFLLIKDIKSIVLKCHKQHQIVVF